MASTSMNARLNIEKLDGNSVQKHRGSKQVVFKQLGSGVKTGVHGVHVQSVWFKWELHGAQGNHEDEIFQVSKDDATVAQRRLEDKQLEVPTSEEDVEYQYRLRITAKVEIVRI
ncbi:hypothetical protein Tco_0057351 [Tanacetum coccineum]